MAAWLNAFVAFEARYPWWGLAWVAFCIALSVLLRLSRGAPIFPVIPRSALFRASWASGRSRKSFLTALGGARNCLLIGVTKEELIVVPCFPFNLMFLPEVFDLEHRVPRRDIISVDPANRLLRGDVTVIRFRRDDGRENEIELRVADGGDLRSALA